MYIYGGLNENINTTFNDMWTLDLITYKWSKIDYNISNCDLAMQLNITNMNEITNSKIDNIDLSKYSNDDNNNMFADVTNNDLKALLLYSNLSGLPPPRRYITATGRYMTITAESPTFHSQKDGKLLVCHWNSRQYENQFYGDIAPYKKNIEIKESNNKCLYYLQNNKIKDEITRLKYDNINVKDSKHKPLLANFMDYYDRCQLYIFDFKTKQWERRFVTVAEKAPKEFQRSKLVRVGSYIVFVGGRRAKGQATTLSPTDIMLGLKLSMTLLPWDLERLIWIAFYKPNENSMFGKKEMNKDILHSILSFFNQNKFFRG